MTKDEMEALESHLDFLRQCNERSFEKVLDIDFQDYNELPVHLFDILYEIENQFKWTYVLLSQLYEVAQRGVDK